MNKKIIIIIEVVLVLASILILGILAPEIGQSVITYKVESVSFNRSDVVEIDNGDGTTTEYIKLDSDTYQYQLKWTVYPIDEDGNEYATNKKVSFSSNNPNVTVTEGGLVTIANSLNESIKATITIKTQDGDKTDTIDIFKEYTSHGEW